MTMAYIRAYYRVPAKRGGRVKFQGEPGQIIAAKGAYLRLRLESGAKVLVHPTWEMEYLPPEHRAELTGLPRVVDSARQDDKALPKTPPRVRKPLAGPTKQTRQEVWARAVWRCEACGLHLTELSANVHHRQKRRFGDHTAANLVLLCAGPGTPDCHGRVHDDRDGEAWSRGWVVKQWEDPSLIPFVRWDETRFTEKLR